MERNLATRARSAARAWACSLKTFDKVFTKVLRSPHASQHWVLTWSAEKRCG